MDNELVRTVDSYLQVVRDKVSAEDYLVCERSWRDYIRRYNQRNVSARSDDIVLDDDDDELASAMCPKVEQLETVGKMTLIVGNLPNAYLPLRNILRLVMPGCELVLLLLLLTGDKLSG